MLVRSASNKHEQTIINNVEFVRGVNSIQSIDRLRQQFYDDTLRLDYVESDSVGLVDRQYKRIQRELTYKEIQQELARLKDVVQEYNTLNTNAAKELLESTSSLQDYVEFIKQQQKTLNFTAKQLIEDGTKSNDEINQLLKNAANIISYSEETIPSPR